MQQNQGGGNFARYAGEQVNQIPEGYIQAMGTSPFASFLTSAVNAHLQSSKIEADTKTAEATKLKETNAANRLIIDAKNAQTKEDTEETKGLFELHNAQMIAFSNLRDRLESDKDLDANDPKKLKPSQIAALEEQMKVAQANAQWAITQVQRKLSSKIPATQAPETQVNPTQQTYQPRYQQGIGMPLYRKQENFNQAPAQNQGGRGEVGPQGEAGPQGVEEEQAGQPLDTSAQSANTPTQAPAAQGVQFIEGDWPGIKVVPSASIFNTKTGKQWAGNIAANSSGDTFVTANPDLTDPAKVTDPAVLKSNIEEVRKAHLIKFILDGGFAKSVRPDASELINSESYRTPENTPIWSRIEKAHALAGRILSNQPSQYDPDETRLSLAFQQKFGFSPSDYMVWGNRGFGDLAKQNSLATSKLNAERAEATSNINKLLGFVAESQLSASSQADPTAQERAKISRQLESIQRRIGYAADNEKLRSTLSAEANVLETRLKALDQTRQEWESRNRDRKEFRDTQLEVARLALKAQEQATGGGVSALMAREEAVGKAMSGYVGAIPGDIEQYAGFVSAGLRKIPYQQGGEVVRYREIVGPGGTLIPDRMDIPEFVSWSAVNRPDLLVRYAALQPNEKNREAASDLTKKFYGSAVPARKIYEALLLNPGWFDKTFDPTIGAAATVERNSLIANFRQALIGPGNPSNFEQEIMRDVIPDASQIFSINSKSREKMRAIAMMSVMNHYHSMVQNGFEMTEDTLQIYNQNLSKIIGRELTMDDFKTITNYWDNVRAGYAANGYVPGRGNVLTPERSNNTFNAFQDFLDTVVEGRKQAKGK